MKVLAASLCCQLVIEFPVGIRVFVIGPSQIPFFFFSHGTNLILSIFDSKVELSVK